jgi:hypothetical protein
MKKHIVSYNTKYFGVMKKNKKSRLSCLMHILHTHWVTGTPKIEFKYNTFYNIDYIILYRGIQRV